jgi:hypothetical protein
LKIPKGYKRRLGERGELSTLHQQPKILYPSLGLM